MTFLRRAYRSEKGKRRIAIPRKVKSVLALVILTLAICILFDEDDGRRNLTDDGLRNKRDLADDKLRNLTHCKTIHDLLDEIDEKGFRKLHRAPYDSKTLYERLLQLGTEDPCLTEFPVQVQEVLADDEFINEVTEPEFELASDDDDEFLALEDDEGINITPGDDLPPLDEAERDLIDNFIPEAYDIGTAVDGPLEPSGEDYGTVAYTVPLTGCPEWYEPGVDDTGEPPLAPDLYEASAILKSTVCETTEMAASNRRLGISRKLEELQNQTSAADMGYSMHALIHPMTTECPVEGSDGETYDRLKLMKSLDYETDILGQPITTVDLEDAKQYYLMENIEDDVGIRDSTKLHIWRMIYHPAVVLMNFDTVLQQPLDEEIDLLLSDPNMKGMYILNAPDPETGGAGVDTGLLIIKPDLDEYERIVSSYIQTPYLEGKGWNGEGYNDFNGHLGISGFLAYYFDTHPGYKKLDRCTYAHDGDDACNEERDLVLCKASKIEDTVCGNPRDCPYNHPNWSQKKKESCASLHRKYYDYRYKFEEKYFNKNKKQERIGLFKPESFMGYCMGAGKKNSLSMTGKIIPKPKWQTTCPPEGCPQGTYLKPDCSCTSTTDDPCDACPENTFCQKSPSLICIDCTCGFCDSSGIACCDFNGVNNCKSGPGDNKNCNLQFNFYPAFPGAGNACGGVEITRTAVPNGCGCKPNSHTPCTYNSNWGNPNEKCFICSAADMANGQCESCKDCIRSCDDSTCLDGALSEEDFVTCLKKIKDSTCRSSCHSYCMRNVYLTI